jgi:hypothetical protein
MKTLPMTHVAPAENTGIVNAEITVPTPGMALSALVTPIAVVDAVLAGITDPAKLAMSDLPRLSENGTL